MLKKPIRLVASFSFTPGLLAQRLEKYLAPPYEDGCILAKLRERAERTGTTMPDVVVALLNGNHCDIDAAAAELGASREMFAMIMRMCETHINEVEEKW